MFALKLNETWFGRDWTTWYSNIPQKKTGFVKRQKQNKQSHFKLLTLFWTQNALEYLSLK